jgi:hypothetical protein
MTHALLIPVVGDLELHEVDHESTTEYLTMKYVGADESERHWRDLAPGVRMFNIWYEGCGQNARARTAHFHLTGISALVAGPAAIMGLDDQTLSEVLRELM